MDNKNRLGCVILGLLIAVSVAYPVPRMVLCEETYKSG
jgi:hypothetical protein